MHFHLEIRVLVASSVLTNAVTLLADPRYIKISFHFSFMIKTAIERIPFKNYIALEKSSWSHSLSCPLSLYLSLFLCTISLCYYIKNMSSLSFSVSLFSLHFSLFSCVILFNYLSARSLSHTFSLSPTLSNTLCLSFSLFLYFHI